MALVIAHETSIAVPYFRWFDSGDLRGPEHLNKICRVAEYLPQISFWLPTQEHKWAKRVKAPSNLTIRLSARLIDGSPPKTSLPTSSVVTSDWTCPAEEQGNTCGSCRKCWDSKVKHVSYKLK